MVHSNNRKKESKNHIMSQNIVNGLNQYIGRWVKFCGNGLEIFAAPFDSYLCLQGLGVHSEVADGLFEFKIKAEALCFLIVDQIFLSGSTLRCQLCSNK